MTLFGKEIALTGAAIDGETIDLTAQQNLLLTTIEENSYSKIGSGDNYSLASATRQVGSSIKGSTISLSAGEDLTLHGSLVAAQQDAQLVAGGDLIITSAEERSAAQTKNTRNSLLNSRSSEKSSETVSQVASVVEAGGRLDLYAGVAEKNESRGNLTIAGSRLDAGSDLSLYATGDLLVVCSDGITEAANRMGEMYGHDRLLDAISRHRTLSATDLVSAILREVDEFSAGMAQSDDQTVVVLKSR